MTKVGNCQRAKYHWSCQNAPRAKLKLFDKLLIHRRIIEIILRHDKLCGQSITFKTFSHINVLYQNILGVNMHIYYIQSNCMLGLQIHIKNITFILTCFALSNCIYFKFLKKILLLFEFV